MSVPTMQKKSTPLAERVLTYWYGENRAQWYDSHPDKLKQWFFGGAAVDEEIRAMFAENVEAALKGEYDATMFENGTCDDSLALVIMLDQFTRNLYRGTARAFSGDAKAVQISRRAAKKENIAEKLRPAGSCFMYMPLMHSEQLADQKLCIQVFTATQNELKAEKGDEVKGILHAIGKNLEMAHDHHNLVEKFGRFPHRNKAMGRESTPEEVEYLKDAATYGQ